MPLKQTNISFSDFKGIHCVGRNSSLYFKYFTLLNDFISTVT